MSFIPENVKPEKQIVPFFEDSATAKLAGHGTTKSIKTLQTEVADEIYELGGELVRFQIGKYPGNPTREGYQITFVYQGQQARLDVSALPLRTVTDTKRQQALAQALFLIRDWLRGERMTYVYRPGAFPLMPFLIGSNGQTVTEMVMSAQLLVPVLGSGQ